MNSRNCSISKSLLTKVSPQPTKLGSSRSSTWQVRRAFARRVKQDMLGVGESLQELSWLFYVPHVIVTCIRNKLL